MPAVIPVILKNNMGDMIGIHQQHGTIQAYVAMPDRMAKFKGAVIVAHELWGLSEHIKSVANRLAGQGFYALAPDLYSGHGGRSPSEELQRELFSTNEHVRAAAQPKLRALLAPTQTPQFTTLAISRLESCFEYVYSQPLVHQKVAYVGYGLGGNYALSMAVREPRLIGVVAFYGHSLYTTAELEHVRCPILSFYGDKEKSLIMELHRLTANMHQANVDFRPIVYKGIGHAFFNDSNPFAYNQDAAADAWRRMLNFLNEQMGNTL